VTSRDFCYWLQGYFEINGEHVAMTTAQAQCVKAHLALVFKHEIDPSYGDAEHQAKLNEIHETAKKAQKTAEEAKKAANGPHEPPVFRC